jgi:hypothetical protein
LTPTRATRIRVTTDDLKDIKPDSALYKRVVEDLAEFEDGVPYREYAADHIEKDGDIEIDEDAVVSLGADDGAYIMCWKWIDHDAMREYGYLENEKDEDD